MIYITPWERDLLQLLADGMAPHAVADHISVSVSELKTSLAALFARLGAESQSDALAAARQRGLLASGGTARSSQTLLRSVIESPLMARQ